jgi:hypothetical protein
MLEGALMVSETALLSEQALAEDWNRPEEDEAWLHLRSGSVEDAVMQISDDQFYLTRREYPNLA